MPSEFQQWLESPEGQAAMGGEGPQPLGPYGSTSPTNPADAANARFAGRYGGTATPNYSEGDEWGRFVGLSAETAWSWQRKLVDAGLLAGTFRRGVWDDASAQAMGAAMAYGNAWGTDYGVAINRLATAPERDTEADPAAQLPPRNQFMQPAYQKPTGDMLAQEVKSFVRDRLGREPDDVDIDTLTSALARIHRGDYDQQVDHDRSEFGRGEDARLNEAQAGIAGDATAAAAGPAGEFDAAGPDAVAAAFAEEFESTYANELDRNTRVEEGAESEQGFMASILSSDRAIGAL